MAAYVPIAEIPPSSPPRLHWGLLLLLTVITLGYFGIIWMVVQANWVRRVRGTSTGFILILFYCAFVALSFCTGVVYGLLGVQPGSAAYSLLNAVVGLGGMILFLCALYILRSELQDAPINLSLGGVMTFFFNVVYFQYHLQDYHLEEQVSSSRSPLSII